MSLRNRAVLGLSLAVAATGSYALPASANPAGTGLVISEVYGGGGNSGATLAHDFIELSNPTGTAIDVDGWSIQYRSSGSTAAASGTTPLAGSVPPGGHYLVQEAAGTGGTDALPTPDAVGTIAMSGSAFTVWLSDGVTRLAPPAGDATGTAGVIDLLGVNSNTFEAVKAPGLSNTTSDSRTPQGADSDDNSADFAAGGPTPTNAAGDTTGNGGGDGGPTDPPVEFTGTIAEVQGTGDASPHQGELVTTTGVVTAAYPSGGFYGYVIQTPGTGGADDASPGASDALYAYQPSGSVDVQSGDYVQVKGLVSEFKGLTEIAVAKGDVTDLGDAPAPVTALATDYPTTDTSREAHESELLDVSGQHFTVTDNYSTNQYAEIGLATGDVPLLTPTDVADAQDAGAIAAVEADNARRAVTLDDGASISFLPYGSPSDSQDIPLPWLGTDNPVRVSSQASFRAPVILDYRNDTWKFQPTHRVIDEGTDVATFSDTRSENAAPQDVGGDLRLATFNVLNYFPTTGEDFVAAGGSCTYYVDRDNDPVTDDRCNPEGPRGAAEDEDLQRQQAKIVTAINTMDADIVSLEEIENSVKFDQDRDAAVSTLVDALNADAGSTRWAYAPSPAAGDLPPLADQDVIRTAFIYNPNTVDLVGGSRVLTGSDAFYNARQPLAQAFKPRGAADTRAFGVIVNHFKSKGSGTDDGTGQGNANPDRVAQAHALSTFASGFAADRGIESLFLTGDFNAYSMEDPIQVLEDDGYTNLQSDTPDEWTYNYGGQAGSLDHVLASQAARDEITGVDIWNINADEAVAFEYSRDNYNATDFYQVNQFRASDHDPEVVGIDVPGFPVEAAASTLAARAGKVTYGRGGDLTVTVTAANDPSGTVQVLDGERLLGEATLSGGTATVTLGTHALRPGRHQLTVTYSGDEDVAAGSTGLSVTVASAKARATQNHPAEKVRS